MLIHLQCVRHGPKNNTVDLSIFLLRFWAQVSPLRCAWVLLQCLLLSLCKCSLSSGTCTSFRQKSMTWRQKKYILHCAWANGPARWSGLGLKWLKRDIAILFDFTHMRSSLTLCFFQRDVFCFCVFAPGMNLNKRELNEHVEFESQTYYAAFAAELEACAQPMWGLLTHCKVKVSPVFTLSAALDALQDDYTWCIRPKY